MAGGSKKAIYGAIGANTAIAISKFTAAWFTGSASMMSEGIHSLVDTFNGVLLLFGLKRAKKKPDSKHPYGYGNEVYFWSFVVAVMIFALGGGVALVEGIEHLIHPSHMEYSIWNYVVLGLAIVFEGFALRIALKEFNKSRGDKKMVKALSDSKDTSTSAVVIEDTAALLGLVIALICVSLGHLTGNIYFDGIGSVLIGVLLIGVSWFFAAECKGLLIGEGLLPHNVEKVIAILENEPHITDYNRPLSLYFGPNEVLVNLDVTFKPDLNAKEIEETVDRIESAIKAELPRVNRIFIEAEAIVRPEHTTKKMH